MMQVALNYAKVALSVPYLFIFKEVQVILLKITKYMLFMYHFTAYAPAVLR